MHVRPLLLMSELWHRFTGDMIDCQPVVRDRNRWNGLKQAMDGTAFEIAIRPERRHRTLPQNAMLHVLATVIAKHTGDSVLVVKRRATLEALGLDEGQFEYEYQGVWRKEVRPTSSLSRSEESLVIDRLIQTCEFLAINPPREEEVEVMD